MVGDFLRVRQKWEELERQNICKGCGSRQEEGFEDMTIDLRRCPLYTRLNSRKKAFTLRWKILMTFVGFYGK